MTTTTQRNISPHLISPRLQRLQAASQSALLRNMISPSSPRLAPLKEKRRAGSSAELLRSNVLINVRCYRIPDQTIQLVSAKPRALQAHVLGSVGEDLGLSLAMFNVLRMHQSVCHEDLGVENCSSPSECLHTTTRHRSNERKMMREAHQHQHSPRQLSLLHSLLLWPSNPSPPSECDNDTS